MQVSLSGADFHPMYQQHGALFIGLELIGKPFI
jgi:hypothetical protein